MVSQRFIFLILYKQNQLPVRASTIRGLHPWMIGDSMI